MRESGHMNCKYQGIRMDPVNYFGYFRGSDRNCDVAVTFCHSKGYSRQLVNPGMFPVKNNSSTLLNPVHDGLVGRCFYPVSYTHLRAHETDSYLVCRLL